jgi:thiol-disulfide isomerase/thioredoxin
MGAKEFSQDEIVEMQKQLGFHGELALNSDNSVGSLFHVTGFPSMFVIGKDGKVAAANSGNLPDLESKVAGQVDALLQGAAATPAALPNDEAAKPIQPSAVPAKPSHHSTGRAFEGANMAQFAAFTAQDQPKPQPAPAQEPPKPQTPPAPAPKPLETTKLTAEQAKQAPAAKRTRAEELLGKPAPTLSLKTTAGKDLSNDTFDDGPATVLNFFAGNCGYCKKQIPRVEALRKEYAAKGVRFVNVAETMSKEFSEQEIMDVLKPIGWEGELARDPKNEFGPPFGASGFPTMVIVGKSGKIEAVNVGNMADLETRMKGQLDALVAGTPIPAQFVQAPPKPAADPAAGGKPEDMVGKPVPAFDLKTLEGKDVSAKALAGSKAAVLNFFAPNCGFCKKQIPRLETVRKEYTGKPVEFVYVKEMMGKEFTDDETITILKEVGWEGTMAADAANAIGKKFNVRGFPTMVVIGNGKVQAVNVGNIGDLESKLKGQLDSLIAGKDIAQAPPPAAKPGEPAQAGAKSAPTDWVGHPSPAFALKTTDGKAIENGNLAESKATVLNFFAPNCGFCKKQIPRLETIRKEYAGKPVRFVNVKEAMGKEYTDEEAMTTLKEVGWEGDMAADAGNAVGGKFNVRGFPTMVIVGSNGKVQAVNVGNIADLETKMKEQLDTLIAGKELAAAPAAPSPATAEAAPPKRRPAEEMRGQKAPEFKLTTLDGKTVSSDEFDDHKATVLNFVAPNCGFCKKQVPNVEKVRAEYADKGVRFVNMVQKMGTKDFETSEITDIFKQAGSNLDLAKDEGNTVGAKYKVVSFPTMFVVSKDGTITEVAIGAKADLETTLKAKLDELIKADQ